MKRLIFISRHAPTQEQIALAEKLGYHIIHVGDVDAFAPDLLTQVRETVETHKADALSTVHPNILATQAIGGWGHKAVPVWIFKNDTRPVEGGKPQFVCGGVTIWHPQTGEGFFEMSPEFHKVE
jgi:hypothetical protein